MSIKRNVSPLQEIRYIRHENSYHTFNFDLVMSDPTHTSISRYHSERRMYQYMFKIVRRIIFANKLLMMRMGGGGGDEELQAGGRGEVGERMG